MDQWNWIEHPEKSSCSYNQLILDRSAKNALRKEMASSAIGAGNTGYPHIED
jgi:hypothetical protein